MKNNRGWSFREMILFMIIFVIILIIVSIKVHIFYKNVGKTNEIVEPIINDIDDFNENEDDDITEVKKYTKEDYQNLEQVLVDATLKYIDENRINESFTISSDILIDKGYLSSTDLLDLNDKTPCRGESNVTIHSGNIDVIPNLQCSNYQTGD